MQLLVISCRLTVCHSYACFPTTATMIDTLIKIASKVTLLPFLLLSPLPPSPSTLPPPDPHSIHTQLWTHSSSLPAKLTSVASPWMFPNSSMSPCRLATSVERWHWIGTARLTRFTGRTSAMIPSMWLTLM